MAETSKSFWGKFSKSKLKQQPFHSKLPIDLIEMFPTIDCAKLYYLYSKKCDKSISKTVEYLTKDQPSNFTDEIPINILIESLSLNQTLNENNPQIKKKNYFHITPTHILSHIFSFMTPMTLGTITRLNRECRLLSKSLLSRIKVYDFSYFYHNHLKNKKYNRISDDELRLISHINAFQYLESLSLRSSYFTKWHSFTNITDNIKRNIKYLNLSHSINLYDDAISIICEQFTNLEILNVSNCIELTDLAITNIIENTMNNKLHTIYLNYINNITTNGIKQLIKYKKSIQNIEWKGSKYGNIKNCFVNAKHIKYFNLSSNYSVQQFIVNISIKNSNENDNYTLDLNLSNCKSLRFINLDISYLKSLNITQCLKLREVRIENANKLAQINCKGCKILELLAVPCKTMEIAELSGCNRLNLELLFHNENFLIHSLLNNKLKSLDLSLINHINDEMIDSILQINETHSFPLKSLSVAQCKQISNIKQQFITQTFAKPKTNSQRVQKRKQWVLNRKARKYNF